MAALRRRLTLLMAALTSLVLAGALAVTWQYAAAQFETSAEMLLSQNFSAICDRLDSAESVSDVWLRECDLLEALLRAPGQLHPRAALLARVWGPLAEVEEANLDCYIHFVRRRLNAVGSNVKIVTVRGSGYKAEAPL